MRKTMAENTPNPAPNPAAPKRAARGPAPDAGHIPITEEMDSYKWTLPPVAPVIIVVLVLGAIVGAFAWFLRAKP
ncbi:MAG: hypothetical protein JO187_01710, partial [Acidobacteria bacterium]|nr:hypothetical protein [Acidobacteriota bacterium]